MVQGNADKGEEKEKEKEKETGMMMMMMMTIHITRPRTTMMTAKLTPSSGPPEGSSRKVTRRATHK